MEGYYTVSEFAKKFGKDPGNIRRMLIYGTLIGEKLGNQWIIPKDTRLPDDGRVKSGDYKNWRKRMDINQKCPGLLQSLNEMSCELSKIYGKKLDKVILYGSYARGEQTKESDVDVAVLLKGKETERQHEKMIDIVVDYELNLEVTLSVVPIEYNNFIEWKVDLPFYKNIDREGIVVWKTA